MAIGALTVNLCYPGGEPSYHPQLRAGGGKLSLASLVALAPAPHSAVGVDGGAPAVHADAPDSVVLADGGAPAAHDP